MTFNPADRYRKGDIVRYSRHGILSHPRGCDPGYGVVVADPIKDVYPTQTVIVKWEGRKRSFEIAKRFIERVEENPNDAFKGGDRVRYSKEGLQVLREHHATEGTVVGRDKGLFIVKWDDGLISEQTIAERFIE
jgi:hypothetical protein